jgi:hypothetical protein
MVRDGGRPFRGGVDPSPQRKHWTLARPVSRRR